MLKNVALTVRCSLARTVQASLLPYVPAPSVTHLPLSVQRTPTPEAETQPDGDACFHAKVASQGVLLETRDAYSHPVSEEQLVATSQLLFRSMCKHLPSLFKYAGKAFTYVVLVYTPSMLWLSPAMYTDSPPLMRWQYWPPESTSHIWLAGVGASGGGGGTGGGSGDGGVSGNGDEGGDEGGGRSGSAPWHKHRSVFVQLPVFVPPALNLSSPSSK